MLAIKVPQLLLPESIPAKPRMKVVAPWKRMEVKIKHSKMYYPKVLMPQQPAMYIRSPRYDFL